MKKLRAKHLLGLPGILFAGIILLTSCAFSQPIPTATVTATLTLPPTATVTPSPSNWQILQPGLERRTLTVQQEGPVLGTLHIFRFDPNFFRFDVAYDPKGQTLEAWQAGTGALAVVNGGYFRQEDEIFLPNGLTVVDGIAMGESYDAFGGMLAINEAGPELRWLAQQPYDRDEKLLAALQSFPILVKPGGEIGFPAEYEDHITARRTAIAQDQSGRILILIAPHDNLTLHQLSIFLTHADLELTIAFNLDGGPSSGIQFTEPYESIQALVPLPVVITIQNR